MVINRRISSPREVLSERNRTRLYNRWIHMRTSEEEIKKVDDFVVLKGFKNRAHFIMTAVYDYISRNQ